jgi:hypothetical protein
MSNKAQAAFSMKSWDENTWEGEPAAEVSGAKLSHAKVAYTYQGDLVGESKVQYLMAYVEEAAGSFTGLEAFTGSLAGRLGSFILQHTGTFKGDTVEVTLRVVPSSGTGELAGLRGEAVVKLVGHQESYPIALDYELT